MIHIFLLHSFMISMSNRLVKFLVKNKSCIEFFHEKIKHFKHTLKHKTFTYFIKKLVCLVFYFKILDTLDIVTGNNVTGNKTMHLNHFISDRYREIMLLLPNCLGQMVK